MKTWAKGIRVQLYKRTKVSLYSINKRRAEPTLINTGYEVTVKTRCTSELWALALKNRVQAPVAVQGSPHNFLCKPANKNHKKPCKSTYPFRILNACKKLVSLTTSKKSHWETFHCIHTKSNEKIIINIKLLKLTGKIIINRCHNEKWFQIFCTNY